MKEKILNNIKSSLPQIKICGLTRVNEAVSCSELGPDAIGLVFFEKSPRNVSIEQAKEISVNLPDAISKVGVFVNETFDFIMERVDKCFLDVVQLHGNESPDLVTKLKKENLTVIKCLYIESTPSLDTVSKYHASGYLVECAKGVLPGGNALSWNFQKAKDFGDTYPLILAGGLSPSNVTSAIESSLPDAVDVSSGVENEPGRKDISKIKAFIEAVSKASMEDKNNLRRIF